MYFEKTSEGKYALQDLDRDQVELIMEGLIVLKNEKLTDAERYASERKNLVEMYHEVDKELVKDVHLTVDIDKPVTWEERQQLHRKTIEAMQGE